MEEREILDCIRGLVAEEHWLRRQRDTGGLSEEVEVLRLSEVERNLSQLWDLLRQRRAMHAAGPGPDVSQERPSSPLDSHLQWTSGGTNGMAPFHPRGTDSQGPGADQ